MDRSEVRRILMYWGNAYRARREKAEKIAEIDAEIQGLYDVKTQQLSGMPHGTGVGDPTAQQAMRISHKIKGLQSCRERCEMEIADLDKKVEQIETEVMCLPPLEYETIKLRYVRYGVAKSGYWLRIARRLNVSVDHAKTLERNGVDKLRKNLTLFNTISKLK